MQKIFSGVRTIPMLVIFRKLITQTWEIAIMGMTMAIAASGVDWWWWVVSGQPAPNHLFHCLEKIKCQISCLFMTSRRLLEFQQVVVNMTEE